MSEEIIPVDNTMNELDILSHGVNTVRLSIENLIDLITVDRVEDMPQSRMSNALLLSTLHGLTMQLREIQRRMNQPFVIGGTSSEVDQEVRERIIQADIDAEELRTQIKAQQERIRTLESEERMAGFKEKVSRMERDIDARDAKLSYYEELDLQVTANMKRSKKRRKNLGSVKQVAAENVAHRVNRDHGECKNCAHRYAIPPVCKGHASGKVDCILFSPKGYTEET